MADNAAAAPTAPDNRMSDADPPERRRRSRSFERDEDGGDVRERSRSRSRSSSRSAGSRKGGRKHGRSRSRSRDRRSRSRSRSRSKSRGKSPEKRRAKNACYKCGGDGHIAIMCPSPRGAVDDPSAPVCHHCKGRGHFLRICPNNLDREQCFRCGGYGHRGKNCQFYNMQMFQAGPPPFAGGGGGGGGRYAGYPPRGQQYASQYAASGSVTPGGSGAATASGYMASGGGAYGAAGTADPTAGYNGYQGGTTGGGYNTRVGLAAYGMAQNPGGYVPGYGGGFAMGSVSGAPQSFSGRRSAEPAGGDKCFRCGEFGHWTRECPQRPDGDPEGCYKCGQKGHHARECTACFRCLQPGHKAAECPNFT